LSVAGRCQSIAAALFAPDIQRNETLEICLMKIDLFGKAALVTGSTAGIGHAIAKGLAAAGAEVVVNGRTQGKVDAAAAALANAAPGSKVRGIAADVSTAAGCKSLIAALPEVDILINNAGIFEPKDFFNIPDEDWSRFFETNLMSGVRLSRAYLPGMLKRNWGRIVFISSESALNIPKEMIHYGTTKTAQLAVSRGLAEMTRGTAVTVNSVLPGPTMSEGVETFVKGLAKQNGQSVEEAASRFVKQFRDLAAAAFCQRGRDRQHGGLCRFTTGVRDQRRRPSRRRRHRPDHRVRYQSVFKRSGCRFTSRNRIKGTNECRPMSFPKSRLAPLRTLRPIASSQPGPSSNMAGAIWYAAARPTSWKVGLRRTPSSSSSFRRCSGCANGTPRRNMPKRSGIAGRRWIAA
jgi:NAD(P)-dependent dehydrogenase (short-subunit alcohol dehydrogenase family)